MIDEKNSSFFPEITLQALASYFEEKERRIIETELHGRSRIAPGLIAEKQREKELLKDEERTAVSTYLANNREGFFASYQKRHNSAILFCVIMIIIGLIGLSISVILDMGVLAGVFGPIFVVGVTFWAVITPDTKEDYVINKFEQEVGRKIEHLEKADIRQLYEEVVTH